MNTILIDSEQNISFENGLLNVNNFDQTSPIEEIELSYFEEIPFNFSSIYLSLEENQDLEKILQELNEAIQIDIDPNKNFHNEECEEIISILKKPTPKKNTHKKNKERNMFKCFKTPKKISLVGRVLSDTPSNETKNSSGQTNPETLSMA